MKPLYLQIFLFVTFIFVRQKDDFDRQLFYKIEIGGEYFHEDFERSTLIGLEFTKKSFGFKESWKLISVFIFCK